MKAGSCLGYCAAELYVRLENDMQVLKSPISLLGDLTAAFLCSIDSHKCYLRPYIFLFHMYWCKMCFLGCQSLTRRPEPRTRAKSHKYGNHWPQQFPYVICAHYDGPINLFQVSPWYGIRNCQIRHHIGNPNPFSMYCLKPLGQGGAVWENITHVTSSQWRHDL